MSNHIIIIFSINIKSKKGIFQKHSDVIVIEKWLEITIMVEEHDLHYEEL